MPVIKDEILLDQPPEAVFNEVSDINFLKKAGASPGIENIVSFQDERVIQYTVKGVFNGIPVSMKSERILIPESMTVVNTRSGMPGITYAMNIFTVQKHGQGSKLTLIEDFKKESGEPEPQALENNVKRNRLLAESLAKYLNGKK